MNADTNAFYEVLRTQFLLPILRLDDADACFKLAECLSQTGFPLLEITLTTPDALALIRRLNIAGVTCGAGTVLTAAQATAAIDAGSRFLVSPGLSAKIADIAAAAAVPYIGGVQTATEVMQALELGLSCLKLFPASSGGIEHLKALKGPFPQVSWLPTGGIEFAELPAWRAAGALAVGQGTRLVSASALARGDWDAIRAELTQIKQHLEG